MAKWQIILKDGTKFTGKRTFKTIWIESLLGRAYEVTDSNNPNFPKGTVVEVLFNSALYRIKVK